MSTGEAPQTKANGDGSGLICSGEAYVWVADLDRPQAEITALEALLSADERLRAERLHFVVDRQRFITGRAILRMLLGSLLETAPSEVRFQYGPSGKPFLDPRRNPEDLRFNCSHAKSLALYGVTKGREIGIDLEYLIGDLNYVSIIDHFFSSPESQALRALPDGERLHAFYAYWTRKEAYLKGIGSGLGVALDQFSVSPGNDTLVRIGRAESSNIAGSGDLPGEAEEWRASDWLVYEVAVPPDYCAALAVDGRISRLHQCEVACRGQALVLGRQALS